MIIVVIFIIAMYYRIIKKNYGVLSFTPLYFNFNCNTQK